MFICIAIAMHVYCLVVDFYDHGSSRAGSPPDTPQLRDYGTGKQTERAELVEMVKNATSERRSPYDYSFMILLW